MNENQSKGTGREREEISTQYVKPNNPCVCTMIVF